MHEDVAEDMDNPPKSAGVLSHQQVDKGHGRVEKRTASICHDVDWLQERHDWPGLSAIGKVVGERCLGVVLDGPVGADEAAETLRGGLGVEQK